MLCLFWQRHTAEPMSICSHHWCSPVIESRMARCSACYQVAEEGGQRGPQTSCHCFDTENLAYTDRNGLCDTPVGHVVAGLILQ
ncbi:hypothetical protein DOTSEDRAFT_72749 [Dothistroma septosporum NZE10]|uniref:Uncharacterized protein n=1 Tax=Dothistroma septosporum (strain NZE10 / CBS 128990) TaxID=675120 RepID=M2WN81_DOTSN|nr:hypothetical protein DOTSEDRAFT_72749 [Dothistroma septosporum NZE10]